MLLRRNKLDKEQCRVAQVPEVAMDLPALPLRLATVKRNPGQARSNPLQDTKTGLAILPCAKHPSVFWSRRLVMVLSKFGSKF